MSEIRKNLGGVTAYAYARSKGYAGTEEEFAQLMANYATVGETATEAAEQATTKAGEASTSATNAASSASAASASATAAAGSASAAATSETNAAASASSASTSAGSASESANDAAESAAAAQAVKDSIPADYTALSGEVTDLKNAFGHISEKGKNLFPIETKTTASYGVSVEYENGILTFSGTASGSNPDYSYSACTPVTLPAGKYTFSRNAAKGQTILRRVNGTRATNIAVLQGSTNTTTFTLAEATELYLYIGSLSGSITTTQIKIQLESGETKTDWEEPWESAVDKIARFHKTSLELTWTSGKAFIYNAGWSNNSGWSYADVILTQGESIIVSLNVSTTVYPLSVWSDDGNSIIKVCFPIADSAGYKTLTYTCASDKERVRINVQNTNKANVIAEKYNVGDLLNQSNIKAVKNAIPCFDVLYDSIIAIGDSLTQGSYTGSDLHTSQSYPAFLAKTMGNNVENAGRAGWTTLQWWAGDSTSQKGFPYYSYGNYDAAVICLGTNSGLTDTLATDVDPYDDYHDYADTNTGAYCKIIEGMLAQNQKLIIFLCNIWAGGGTGGVSVTNDVIGKIAAKYGLPVIDLKSELMTAYSAYHAVSGNIHLGRIGYAKMAGIIREALNDYVMTNPAKFNYIPD